MTEHTERVVMEYSRAGMVATEAMEKNRFVARNNGYAAAAGDPCIGVLDVDVALGEQFGVKKLGSVTVEAGGPIALYEDVKSDTAGKGIAQGGSGSIQGYALEAASADGDMIEVFLTVGA